MKEEATSKQGEDVTVNKKAPCQPCEERRKKLLEAANKVLKVVGLK